MSNKILVAYASRGGAAAGVAEAIGQTLADGALEADVYPVQQVTDITPYRAVVIGSAIQGKQWLPEAMQFLQIHQQQLSQKPVAVFLVCMTLALNNASWRYEAEVVHWLAPVRALVNPISEGYFAGTLDISKIPSLADRMKFRLSVWSGVWSEGDHRDWNAIHRWAKELSQKLELNPDRMHIDG